MAQATAAKSDPPERPLRASLRRLGRRLISVRTPLRAQSQQSECGACSLGILLHHYGLVLSTAELRERLALTPQGAQFSDMARVGRELGFEVRFLRREPAEILELKLPLLAYQNFNHSVVIESFGQRWVRLNDPALGRIRLPRPVFDAQFTGMLLEIRPGPKVQREHRSRRLTARILGALLLAAPAQLAMFALRLFSVAALAWVALPGSAVPDLPVSSGHWLALAAVALAGAAGLGQLGRRQLRRRGRAKLIRALARAPEAFYSYHIPAALMERIERAEALADELTHFVERCAAAATSLITLAVMALLEPFLAALAGSGLFLALIIRQSLQRATEGYQLQAQALEERLHDDGWTALQELEQTKNGAQENALQGRIESMLNQLARQLAAQLPPGLLARLVLPLAGLGLAVALLQLAPVNGLPMLLLLLLLWAPWLHDPGASPFLGPDLEKRDDVLESIANAAPATTREAQKIPDDQPLLAARGLAYWFDTRGQPMFEDLNLQLAPGEQVAIVSAPGAGKSTLGRLVAGLLDPREGLLMLAGRRAAAWPAAQRASLVSWVGDGAHFWGGTLRDNLVIGRPKIGDAELDQVLKLVGMRETVAGRRDDLDCWVRDAGQNFSHGERMRLEIARSLLQRPRLMVLDGTLDGIERDLESSLRFRLRELGIALLIISHRDATLSDCDRVLWLDASGLRPWDGAEQEDLVAPSAPPGEPEDDRSIPSLRVALRSMRQCVQASGHWEGDFQSAAAPMAVARDAGLALREVELMRDDWFRGHGLPIIVKAQDGSFHFLQPREAGGLTNTSSAHGPRLGAEHLRGLEPRAYVPLTRACSADKSLGPLARARELPRLPLMNSAVGAIVGLLAVVHALGLVNTEPSLAVPLLAFFALLACASYGLYLGVFGRWRQVAVTREMPAIWRRILSLPVGLLWRRDRAALSRLLKARLASHHQQAAEHLPLHALTLLLCLALLAQMAPKLLLMSLPVLLLFGLLLGLGWYYRDRTRQPMAMASAVRRRLYQTLLGSTRLTSLNVYRRSLLHWQRLAETAEKRRDPLLMAGQLVAFLRGFALLLAPFVAVHVAGLATLAFPLQLVALLLLWLVLLGGAGLTLGLLDVIRRADEASQLAPMLLGTFEGDGQPLSKFRGDCLIEDLIVHHHGAGAPALNGVEMSLRPGEIVALAGPSGSGKSTLLRAILGFVDIQRGEILLDRVSLPDLDITSVRRSIGFVAQDARVETGTIRAAIASDEFQDLASVGRAASLAGMDAWLATLPQGLLTQVSERTLTHGQRQQILIARALVGQPGMLLLDEATSTLPLEEEAVLLENLRKARIATLFTTHRPESMLTATRMILIENGRIVGERSDADDAS